MNDQTWWPKVYEELRAVAAAKLRREAPGQTIDATGLLHEAWARLAHVSNAWRSKNDFFRLASTAMRRILVDRARAKRAGRALNVRAELQDIVAPLPDQRLLALDQALDHLTTTRPEHARLIELRFFGGLTADEAAAALGVSPATADRWWRFARAWLQVEIEKQMPD